VLCDNLEHLCDVRWRRLGEVENVYIADNFSQFFSSTYQILFKLVEI